MKKQNLIASSGVTMNKEICPICNANTVELLDVIDFNKYCTHDEIVEYELSGIPIYYSNCKSCGFTYANDIYLWNHDDFKKKIYNEEYIKYDQDYVEVRPQQSFKFLVDFFGESLKNANHLDYGGGSGRLVDIMNQNGISSVNYEPFSSDSVIPNYQFDLITAFEVLEHVPNPVDLFDKINGLLSDPGIFLFGTQVNDGWITKGKRLDWWYASPRNGHISLFSKKSLSLLAEKYGFYFASIDSGLHLFTKKIPVWANHRLSIPM